MRALWDVAEATSRAAVLESGVQVNEVELAEFERATAPLVQARLTTPALRQLYQDIRRLA